MARLPWIALVLLAPVLALGSGCVDSATRVIDGKRVQLWESDLDLFRALMGAQPDALPDRCAYWTRQVTEAGQPTDFTLAGMRVGKAGPSASLSAFLADERQRTCTATADAGR